MRRSTSREYAPIEYPATAAFSIVQAFSQAVTPWASAPHQGGAVQDSFYANTNRRHAGQLGIDQRGSTSPGVWRMESAALFTVAAHPGCAAEAPSRWWAQERGLWAENPINHDTEAIVLTMSAAPPIASDRDALFASMITEAGRQDFRPLLPAPA